MLITSLFPAEVNEPSGIPKSLGLGWRGAVDPSWLLCLPGSGAGAGAGWGRQGWRGCLGLYNQIGACPCPVFPCTVSLEGGPPSFSAPGSSVLIRNRMLILLCTVFAKN